jgi:adenylate cyclase
MRIISFIHTSAIPIVILIIAITLYITTPAALELLRLKVFDAYQNLKPRSYQRVPISIIDIDEASLAAYGQWPWSRDIMAELILKLRDAGVASIALDMIFAEKDRTSPATLLPKWSKEFAGITAQSHYPDYDALFADALAHAPVVAGVVLSDEVKAQPKRKAGYVEKGQGRAYDFVTAYRGALVNLPEFTEAASANGAFTAIVDTDGIIRKVPLVFQVNGTLFPSLSMEALRVGLGASTYIINTEAGGVMEMAIGDYVIPTDSHGNLWVYYTPPQATRYISAKAVLEGTLAPEALAGHITFVGTSAAGLKDLRSTPLSNITNGVEIHAQALEQIVSGEFLIRPYWIPALELIYIIVAVLAVWAAIRMFSPYVGAMMVAVLFAASLYVSWYSFSIYHVLLDPLTPSIAIIVLYIAETLRNYIASEKERKQVRSAFSHYMSPALVDRLASNPDALTLGGEMKEMTLLFCDIRGFTTISEQFDAQGLTQFINRFLTPMTDIILNHHGTIDKYMGDCIMAFWNAPLDDEQHAKHAAEAALSMLEALKTLNAELQQEAVQKHTKFIPVHIGIGLNTDTCCVGNMGSAQRFDYSVLGDGVNLASRLEGQSKTYGMEIVIGENTYKALTDFAMIELDKITVKGKTTATRIYGLLGGQSLYQHKDWHALKQTSDKMLLAYRSQEWQKALEALSRLETYAQNISLPLQEFIRLYRQRITEYQATPPPEDWNGVTVATSK